MKKEELSVRDFPTAKRSQARGQTRGRTGRKEPMYTPKYCFHFIDCVKLFYLSIFSSSPSLWMEWEMPLDQVTNLGGNSSEMLGHREARELPPTLVHQQAREAGQAACLCHPHPSAPHTVSVAQLAKAATFNFCWHCQRAWVGNKGRPPATSS